MTCGSLTRRTAWPLRAFSLSLLLVAPALWRMCCGCSPVQPSQLLVWLAGGELCILFFPLTCPLFSVYLSWVTG